MSLLNAWLHTVLDALYPRICPLCGKSADRPGRYVCWDCFSAVDLYTESLCEICGRFAEGGVTHSFVCSTCRHLPPAFDRARSAGRFDREMRALIHSFKYDRALWLRDDLVDLLHGCLTGHFEEEKIDVVIPVPLHPVRFRERSYNQSSVLARELAQRINRRFDDRSLFRLRQTVTQTHLHAAERRANMQDAFSVKRPEWIRRRTVLLVDDVMTTGSTLHACARALKKAGADKVWALTLARGQ